MFFMVAKAHGRTMAPYYFCQQFPESPLCIAKKVDCQLCHTSASLSIRNEFGLCIESELRSRSIPQDDEQAFYQVLGDILFTIKDKDCDLDGSSNLDEILSGTKPGKTDSTPGQGPTGHNINPCNEGETCYYKPSFAYKKISIDFCGHSPRKSELDALAKLSFTDQIAALDEKLDYCISQDYWRGKNGVLWQMAHKKFRPNKAIKSGEDGGNFPLVDYYDDYNLYSYTQIDDHDARDMLLADYFVLREGTPSVYRKVDEVPLHPQAKGYIERLAPNFNNTQQWVEKEYRAGLLTTLRNLTLGIMFSTVPRAAAADALRNYLNLDIALYEGLSAIDNEPIDYDSKDVGRKDCAICHSTLDPLAYPFSRYNGFTFIAKDGAINAPQSLIPATYNANRPKILFTEKSDEEHIESLPENGYILG